MPIIDSHHHLWRYEPAEYGWIDDGMSLLKQDFLSHDLDQTLIETEVVASVAVQARQTQAETDWLLSVADNSKTISGVVGWIDLQAPDLDARLSEYEGRSSLKGFRHVLQDEADRALMLRPYFIRGLRTLAKFGYSYDMLVHPDQLVYVEEVCQRVPELRVVLDHIGKPDIGGAHFDRRWAINVRSLAANSSVYCKISGMVTEAKEGARSEQFFPYIEAVADTFGDRRIMFGSDWPVCLLSRSYGDTLDIVKQYELSSGQELGLAFWSTTAKRFYSLAIVDGTMTAA
jgi:L-fuconolactonase